MSETNDFTKPVVFCANFNSKGIGVFVSKENTFCVEVYKEVGRCSYTYSLNGSPQYMSRLTPLEAWELIEINLGATLVKVENKWLNKTFKQEIKGYKENKSV